MVGAEAEQERRAPMALAGELADVEFAAWMEA
jgi:hypothetical protein